LHFGDTSSRTHGTIALNPTTMDTSIAKTTLSFLDIPRELRDKIYK